jgi:aldehyde dehydrogenase (NAD+)
MSTQSIFDSQKSKALELRTEPIKQRIARLKKLRKWVFDNRGRIQQALHSDLRKSPEEADLTEVYVVLSDLKKAIKNLKYWVMSEPMGTSLSYLGTKGEIYYEPKGTVLIISPWNYPFSLAMGPMISAIAAGNTVFVKPSELSENTSELIREMAEELFKEDMVKVVTGGVEASTELLKLPFDHIFFTGSPRVGKIVMEAASKHLASVTLELGGKSPCVVDESASVKDAAMKIAWGKWLNAGQTCVAPDYVLVHERIKTPFMAELKEQAEQLYGGSDYCSIISDGHFERLVDWQKEAVDKGAKLYFEGTTDESERRLAPAIIEDVSEGTHLSDNEIFGPLCVIKSFNSLDEVINLVNSRPKALSAYIFARKNAVVEEFKQRTSAGSFVVNDVVLQFAHPTLPFGGVNNSGIGKSHGKAGFLAFSNEKSVLRQRVGFTMAKTLYPPYTGLKRKIIDLLLRYF